MMIAGRRSTAVVLVLIAFAAAPAHAQLGRFREMVTGSEKGKVYGFDVTEIPAVVFVVDFSIPVELTVDQKTQLRGYLATEAGQYAQRKMLEEGGDVAVMMAGPAGAIVKSAITARRDKVAQARRHVKAAIDGLSESQTLGLVTFEMKPVPWHPDLVAATKDSKKEAKEVVDRAQGGDESGGLLGFGVGLVKQSLLSASGLALQQEMMAAGATPGSGGSPTGAAPATLAGMSAPGMAPAEPPPSARFAPDVQSLVAGLGAAIDMAPAAIVLVVGAPPSEAAVDEILAEVAALNGANVPIHVAEFGSKEGSDFYRRMAEQSGGSYLTAEREEDEAE